MLVVGRGLEPARRRRRVRRASRSRSATRSATIERRGRRRCGPAARRASRWSPAAPRPPASPGSSGRSACPARSAARCDERRRARLRHGRDAGEGPRRRPGSGEDVRCRPPISTSATAARRSGRRSSSCGPSFAAASRATGPRARRRSPRSCAGGARTNPAGQNAGSVFTNPPGDSAGRLIDAAGLKGLRVGSARGVDQARQLHPGRRRRLGRRRARAHATRSGAGRGPHRASSLEPETPAGRVRRRERAMSDRTPDREAGHRPADPGAPHRGAPPRGPAAAAPCSSWSRRRSRWWRLAVGAHPLARRSTSTASRGRAPPHAGDVRSSRPPAPRRGGRWSTSTTRRGRAPHRGRAAVGATVDGRRGLAGHGRRRRAPSACRSAQVRARRGAVGAGRRRRSRVAGGPRRPRTLPAIEGVPAPVGPGSASARRGLGALRGRRGALADACAPRWRGGRSHADGEHRAPPRRAARDGAGVVRLRLGRPTSASQARSPLDAVLDAARSRPTPSRAARRARARRTHAGDVQSLTGLARAVRSCPTVTERLT